MTDSPRSARATRRGGVFAPLNYLAPMPGKPAFSISHPGDGLALVPHVLRISDARNRRTSLDVEGFELIQHRTAVDRLESRRAVLTEYGPEMERLVAEVTGARAVIAAPLGVLRAGEAHSAGLAHHRPVHFVHADHSEASARQALERRIAACPGPAPQRVAIYHAWRVLTPPPQDRALALCDARTVAAQDAVAADSIVDAPGCRPDRAEVTLFRFNPAHRWHYFPDMTREEVLLFKDYDSDPARCTRAPHTAFGDPTCPRTAMARVSLDLQLFAVFG